MIISIISENDIDDKVYLKKEKIFSIKMLFVILKKFHLVTLFSHIYIQLIPIKIVNSILPLSFFL